MASLTSQTVAASYVKILITDSNSGLSGSATNIEDGDGTASPLYLSTSRLGIGQSNPSTTLDVTGDLNVTSTSGLAGTVSIGGGYGSTGITLSDAGVIQANGALTIDGASTLTGAVTASSTATIAGNTTIGGGYGSTGVTLTDAGVVQMNGALTVDGASTLTGAITASSTLAVSGTTTFSDDITLVEGKKIIFDSADTYIKSNSDNPEDLHIGSDADLHLEPDSDIIIYAATTEYARFSASNSKFIIKEHGGVANAYADIYHLYDKLYLDVYGDAADSGGFMVRTKDATVTALSILPDGNVGIGTDTPATALEIVGSSATATIHSSSSGANLKIDSNNDSDSGGIQFLANSALEGTIEFDHHATAASQKMIFKIGDNAVSAIHILGDGKVGIGTDAPAKTLDVFNSSTDQIRLSQAADKHFSLRCNSDGTLCFNDKDGDTRMAIGDFTTIGINKIVPESGKSIHANGTNSGAYIVLSRDETDGSITSNNVLGAIQFAGYENGGTIDYGATITACAESDWTIGSAASTYLRFSTASGTDGELTEKMRINNTGTVGIGNSDGFGMSSTHKLVVVHNQDEGNGLYVYRDKSSSNTNGSVVFIHQDNASDDQNALHVRSDADSAYVQTITHNDADDPRGLKIDFNGGNGFADNNDNFIYCSDTNGAHFSVYGDGDCKNADGTFGTISSDERVKQNITDATGKLDDLLKLKVKNFVFKRDPRNKKQIGFLAQEFETVFPSLVSQRDATEEGGLPDEKSINVGMEFAIIVKAIQELSAQITALTTRVTALESA